MGKKELTREGKWATRKGYSGSRTVKGSTGLAEGVGRSLAFSYSQRQEKRRKEGNSHCCPKWQPPSQGRYLFSLKMKSISGFV